MTTRAISIVTYNRVKTLEKVIAAVLETKPKGTDVFVCDDGSTDATPEIVCTFPTVKYYRGENLGVGANKTRALFLMQNHHYSCILEDDLMPNDVGWFETYELATKLTDIHHWCRIQDKEIPESHPSFTTFLKQAMGVTPIYASSPRGDLTFITRRVIKTVGGMNPSFQGVGYAHGEWSARVAKAGLISHPLSWVDIAEARDKFTQIGDTEGGRWEEDEEKIKKQIAANKKILHNLNKKDYIYSPLRMT